MKRMLCLLRLHAWGFWFRVGHVGNQIYYQRVCTRLPRCKAIQVKVQDRGQKSNRSNKGGASR